jgi:hypothetical protein
MAILCQSSVKPRACVWYLYYLFCMSAPCTVHQNAVEHRDEPLDRRLVMTLSAVHKYQPAQGHDERPAADLPPQRALVLGLPREVVLIDPLNGRGALQLLRPDGSSHAPGTTGPTQVRAVHRP